MRWTRSMVIAALMALTLTVAGCDDGSSEDTADRDAVSRALQAMQRSFLTEDWPGLCARMGADARRQAGRVAGGQSRDCPADLRAAFGAIEGAGGLRGARGSKIVAVDVTGEHAVATVALEGHGRVDVPLVRDNRGDWRLESFFGTPSRRALWDAIAVRTAPFPSARQPVAVADGAGSRCFPIFEDDYPEVVGGCELYALAPQMELAVETPFGRARLGACELTYHVMVDGGGRSWTDTVALGGADGAGNGCWDARGCGTSGPLPWRGRVAATADGRFIHRMDACLSTRLGFYAGPLTVELSEESDGWRAMAPDATVGASGLRLEGTIELTTVGFAPRPAQR